MSESPQSNPGFLALQEALAGRFSLERELGRGGMGIVYLAQDVALDRPVALKLLPPTFAARPDLRERFVREARTAARLSHPHIVPIHLVDEVGDFVFFVMSFVEGETLGQRVRERGPVPAREAARILREVAWALAYAHGQGVVHRDVKPDNILLEAGSGRALVTDFGIAHVGESSGLTSGAELLGTPEFMSPEQAGGEALDGRSDLYSLGVVGHYMLSGELPFQGESARATLAKHLTEPAPPLAGAVPEVPGPLAEAVDRCLEKEPAARPKDGEELAEALGRVLQDRKEVPAAIRVFQEQNREYTGVVGTFMMLFITIGTIMLFVVTEAGEPFSDILPGLVMGALLMTLPVALLGVMARRLLKAGYSHDEMVRALRRDVEERRREVAGQAGRDTALDIWAPRVGWAGVGLFVSGMLAILVPSIPESIIEALFFMGMPLSLGGWGVAAIRGSTRKAVPGSRWLRFWDNPVGKGLFELAGLGVDRKALGSGGSFRPTEMALGMAADRLFHELPRDLRRDLGDVPRVVDALEADAEEMRARIRELGRMLEEAGHRAAPAAMHAPSDPQAAPADELRAAREAAEARLREVVAALESIRLQLLRLHAGAGTVEGLTADLTAARALSEDVKLLADGHREVNEMLGRLPRLPEPDTPVPT